MRPLRIKLRKVTHYYMNKRIICDYFSFFMIFVVTLQPETKQME